MSHDAKKPGRLIQLRRDTEANWTIDNPVLGVGETGWTTDTRRVKLGDGVTAWVDLPYAADEAASVAAETDRAEGAEAALLDLSTAETTNRQDADTVLQTQIDNILTRGAFAVSTDDSFDLPAPTGVGFEWLFTGGQLQGPYMNGVEL